MPIYEFACAACGHSFEAWVRKEDDAVSCSECEDGRLKRLISLPRVHSEGRRARSLRAARKRDSAQSKEMAHAQRLYELAHDD